MSFSVNIPNGLPSSDFVLDLFSEFHKAKQVDPGSKEEWNKWVVWLRENHSASADGIIERCQYPL